MKFITPTCTSSITPLLIHGFKSSISYTAYTRLVNLLTSPAYYASQYRSGARKKAVLLMNSIGVRFSLNQMILLRLRDLKITATGWY